MTELEAGQSAGAEELHAAKEQCAALEADVAAKELTDAKASKQANELKKAKLAEELKQRKAKEEAERIAAAAMERDRTQQAVLNTARPFEGTPTLNETTLNETEASPALMERGSTS